VGSNSEIQRYNVYPMLYFHRRFSSSVTTLQANLLWKITFDILYTNRFVIRIHSRTLSISSGHNTI